LTDRLPHGTLVTMTRCKKTESELKEHWEKILADEGLSMDAGRDPGHRKTVLVGGSIEIEGIYEGLVGENGRVSPKGTGADE
jgi:hypothetical protein